MSRSTGGWIHARPSHMLAFVVFVVGGMGCGGEYEEGSGVRATQTRRIDGVITRVEVRGPLVVELEPCACRASLVSGDDNLVGDVITERVGGTLRVMMNHDVSADLYTMREEMRVQVRTPEPPRSVLSVRGGLVRVRHAVPQEALSVVQREGGLVELGGRLVEPAAVPEDMSAKSW